jgi:hypothetical protein
MSHHDYLRAMLTTLQEEFDRWEALRGLTERQITAAACQRPVGQGRDGAPDGVAAAIWSHGWRAALHGVEPQFHLGPEGLDPDVEENLRLSTDGYTKDMKMPRGA